MRNSGKGRGPKPAPVNREVGVKQTGEATLQTLKLVWSNRCFDMAAPTRLPRVAMSKHLVLVVSN